MRLRKELFSYGFRWINLESALNIGKCINYDNTYWYFDKNYNFVKKDNEDKLYWL